MKNSWHLRWLVAVLGAAMVLHCGPLMAQADNSGDYSLKRTKAVAPSYPRRAKSQGIEGWVDLELTVSPDGEVVDVAVLDADPKGVFERAAIRAVLRWEFEPPSEAGITDNRLGKVRVNFQIAE